MQYYNQVFVLYSAEYSLLLVSSLLSQVLHVPDILKYLVHEMSTVDRFDHSIKDYCKRRLNIFVIHFRSVSHFTSCIDVNL